MLIGFVRSVVVEMGMVVGIDTLADMNIFVDIDKRFAAKKES